MKMTKHELYMNNLRQMSPEVDFGVWWRDGKNYPTYRVSWIQNTGELYAIQLNGYSDNDMNVEIIGIRGTREDIENTLRGWVDKCGEKDSLQWVRDQMKGVSV